MKILSASLGVWIVAMQASSCEAFSTPPSKATTSPTETSQLDATIYPDTIASQGSMLNHARPSAWSDRATSSSEPYRPSHGKTCSNDKTSSPFHRHEDGRYYANPSSGSQPLDPGLNHYPQASDQTYHRVIPQPIGPNVNYGYTSAGMASQPYHPQSPKQGFENFLSPDDPGVFADAPSAWPTRPAPPPSGFMEPESSAARSPRPYLPPEFPPPVVWNTPHHGSRYLEAGASHFISGLDPFGPSLEPPMPPPPVGPSFETMPPPPPPHAGPSFEEPPPPPPMSMEQPPTKTSSTDAIDTKATQVGKSEPLLSQPSYLERLKPKKPPQTRPLRPMGRWSGPNFMPYKAPWQIVQ